MLGNRRAQPRFLLRGAGALRLDRLQVVIQRRQFFLCRMECAFRLLLLFFECLCLLDVYKRQFPLFFEEWGLDKSNVADAWYNRGWYHCRKRRVDWL